MQILIIISSNKYPASKRLKVRQAERISNEKVKQNEQDRKTDTYISIALSYSPAIMTGGKAGGHDGGCKPLLTAGLLNGKSLF